MVILKRKDEDVYLNTDNVKSMTVNHEKEEVEIEYESGTKITYYQIKKIELKEGRI